MDQWKIKNNGSNRKKKVRTWWSILKQQTAEFCLETGLHGYKYIAQVHRSKPERIIWAIAVILSFCCALVLMKLTWDYYVAYPTLTVIDSTHHGIWNYPFPAVTICGLNRVSRNMARELASNLKLPNNVSKEYIVQELKLLNELLDPGIFGYNVEKNLSQLQDIIDYNNLTILDLVQKTTSTCKGLLETCRWKGTMYNCSELFKPSLSRNGACCSFNYVSHYRRMQEKSIKPERLMACGYRSALRLVLHFDPDDYHASIVGTIGAKVVIHSPYDYPDYNAAYKLVEMGTQVFVSIEPLKTYSTPSIRDLDKSLRDCVFNDEGLAVHNKNAERNFTYSEYSYINCLVECRATIIREKCHCIPYFIRQNDTRMCNFRDVQCLYKYRHWYDTSWPGIKLTGETLPHVILDLRKKPCNCMPDCEFNRYNVESSRGRLDKTTYYDEHSYSKNPRSGKSLRNHSILHVFFGDLMAVQYRRHVHYSWRNLFASFGGLLGLFAGFSLMSVFELIYFFIIRIIVNMCIKHH